MKNVDWPQLVKAILETLIITQSQMAERCGVSQQTVSTWKRAKRTPNIYSQRQLANLAQEAGINLIFFTEAPSRALPIHETATRDDAGPRQELLDFARYLERAPEDIRREVIEFARFKMWRRAKSMTGEEPEC